MYDILFLGKEPTLLNGKRYQIHIEADFTHKKDLIDFIAQNVFDFIILDVHHPAKPSMLRKYGYKGLIIGFSDNTVDKDVLVKTLTQGFSMYFSLPELEQELQNIVEAYSNIPEFTINDSDNGFDMEIYDHIIKYAGFVIYQQFAQTFFKTHSKAQWAFISQDMIVIEHENTIKPGDDELSSLIKKNQQYVFLFSREQVLTEVS